MNTRKLVMVFLAIIILIGGTGVVVQPVQAAGCTRYHTVRAGESLSWIGRYYGVSWPHLAQINNIPPPYTIYPGQRICITGTGGTGGVVPPYNPSAYWSYQVTKVVMNTSVSIRTYNFPDNTLFKVEMGRNVGGKGEWRNVGDLDSGGGGTFNAHYNIPAEFAGTPSLVLRLTKVRKDGSMGTYVDRWVTNASTGGGGTGGVYPPYYSGIPTFWIVSVVRNKEVQISTYNFPSGLKFDVFMGPMGTRGTGGIYIGTFDSGAGGVLKKTFPIPPQLFNHYKIAIRTQNLPSGYYSYNWFYNNTTY